MAQKVLVEMVDDITGEPAAQTVPFGLDGVHYEIDLSEDNATQLREELARFVAAATRTGGRKVRLATGQSAAPVSADRGRTGEIRAWARDNGYSVSDRGRISLEVSNAYEEALQEPVAEPVEITAPRKRAVRKKVAAAKS